jgi:hypothetical protein
VTTVDFQYDPSFGDDLTHAAFYAAVIVHEATHGRIRSRGIATTKTNRIRIERICVSEQNLFLRRLDSVRPELGSELIRPFEPATWEFVWNASRFRRMIAHFRRISESKAANKP